MPYRPENDAQARIDHTFRRLGGQVVPMRVDWAKRLESVHAALVLQQLMFESRHHADDDGWFYVTAEDMADLTAVGERGYAAARGKLEGLELIETQKRGMPQRLYIRFDTDALDGWIDAVATPRDLFRHMAEQAPPASGTSSAPKRNMNRPKAEHSIEDENLDENLLKRDLSIGQQAENWGIVDTDLVKAYIEDYAREFGDEASIDASAARASALWARSGVAEGQFISALTHARKRTQRFTGTIAKHRSDGNGKNKMPYFFAVLERMLTQGE